MALTLPVRRARVCERARSGVNGPACRRGHTQRSIKLNRGGTRLYVNGKQNKKRPFCMKYREMANRTERSSQHFKISAWLFPKTLGKLTQAVSRMSTPLEGTFLADKGFEPFVVERWHGRTLRGQLASRAKAGRSRLPGPRVHFRGRAR